MKQSNNRTIELGITLIELLVVIGIIILLAASAVSFSSRFILNSNLRAVTRNTIGVIRKAQGYALDNKNDVIWGACLSGNSLRLFSGTCSAPTFSEDISIPTSVTISGFDEIFFSKLRGEPSAGLNIIVSTTLDSNTIQLNAAGGIEIN